MAAPEVPLPPGEEQGLPDMEMPSAEKLLELLNQMEGISEEDREELRKELFIRQHMMDPPVPGVFTNQALMLLIMLGIVALIFVFFGYKLYKSLKERERKREEKRKMKQQKKKK
ncbi:uncharacterized protein [Anabrus simplex]|uniref:uncharacterized protein isoform X2 n=1 Tax=Anabrus simplex TaxID=316456 RepID=UPI0034DD9A3A